MYATREECGLDPTMIPISDDENGVNYDILVHSKMNPLDQDSPVTIRKFRTVDVIVDHADDLQGGSTRVWKVREVVRGGRLSKQMYVLKDAWVDSQVPREADVVRSIRADAATLKDKEKKKTLLDCLITTIADGDVINEDGTVQWTGDLRRLLHVEISETSTPRTHNRIVFREICQPLGQLTSLKQILWVLWKATAGQHIASGERYGPNDDYRSYCPARAWMGSPRYQ